MPPRAKLPPLLAIPCYGNSNRPCRWAFLLYPQQVVGVKVMIVVDAMWLIFLGLMAQAIAISGVWGQVGRFCRWIDAIP